MRIAFLACAETMPGAPDRRPDAFEHDLQIGALRAGLDGRGTVVDIDWRAPIGAFDGFDLALLGTPWDYFDRADEFLARLEALEARGVIVANAPAVVRWNLDKGYLAELAGRGAAAIPTLLIDDPGRAEVEQALDHFACDRVVVKRRVGAGALGQFDFTRERLPDHGWRLGHRALVQPFLPGIVAEGEYAMVFVGGAFSHALVKRAAPGDYRVQSLYGGQESAIDPAPADRAAAEAIFAALPFPAPLYARIDLVRGPDGALCLMEAELIEPFLYPLQDAGFAARYANAVLACASRG